MLLHYSPLLLVAKAGKGSKWVMAGFGPQADSEEGTWSSSLDGYPGERFRWHEPEWQPWEGRWIRVHRWLIGMGYRTGKGARDNGHAFIWTVWTTGDAVSQSEECAGKSWFPRQRVGIHVGRASCEASVGCEREVSSGQRGTCVCTAEVDLNWGERLGIINLWQSLS